MACLALTAAAQATAPEDAAACASAPRATKLQADCTADAGAIQDAPAPDHEETKAPPRAAASPLQGNQRTFAAMLHAFARLTPQAQLRDTRRQHLTPELRAQCNALDAQLPMLEQRAHAPGEAGAHAKRLHQARKLYRAIGC